MAGEKEVKAQVRLRFLNVKREKMTATRNLQVTVKKGGGLTMKTLEGLLAKVDVGGDANDKVGPIRCHLVAVGPADRRPPDAAQRHLHQVR